MWMPVIMLYTPATSWLVAACRADAFAAVEVLRRLMFADAVRAGRQVRRSCTRRLRSCTSWRAHCPGHRANRSARPPAKYCPDCRSRNRRRGSACTRPAIEPGNNSPKLYSMPSTPQLSVIWLILSPGGETSATPPELPGVSLPSSQPTGWTSITVYVPAARLVNL